MGVNALQLGYLNFDHPTETDFRIAAERCITCGACAANCPNEAMVMRDQEGERLLSSVRHHLEPPQARVL